MKKTLIILLSFFLLSCEKNENVNIIELNSFYKIQNEDVLYLDILVKGANANTFDVIKDRFAKDENSYYYAWEKFPYATKWDNVEYIWGDYIRVKDKIYFKSYLVKDVNSKSFKRIVDRNKTHVYNYNIWYDKKHTYMNGEKVNFDGKTLKYIDGIFMKDIRTLYKVPPAHEYSYNFSDIWVDWETFKSVYTKNKFWIYEDKNALYIFLWDELKPFNFFKTVKITESECKQYPEKCYKLLTD